MGLAERVLERDLPLSGVGANETTGISIYDWAKTFAPGAQVAFNGNMYQAFSQTAQGASQYGTNPVVFSVAAIRMLLFSEARFQFQQLRNGKPGDLFGTPDLSILETPWPGHTTRDLLTRAELDVTAAGNSYWVNNGGYLFRLDPAKVGIVTEKVTEQELGGYEIGEKLSYYLYKPDADPKHWTLYTPDEVCHYMPYPSPSNQFLGQSWLSPCLGDVQIDQTINTHKIATISNGASLSYVVSFDKDVSPENFAKFVDQFKREKEGPQNASKTLFLGAGADVKTVGQTFENLALQATQGASEVRIAAAAGVPPAIVGFSEGLKGSSLNAGNYGEARRRLSDVTMRPLWGAFCSSMSSLINVPSASRLWFDDAHIAFMREDQADIAQILDSNTAALQKLIQAGYEPDAAVDAVLNNDLARLSGHHTGLYSVQLQPPADGEMSALDAPNENAAPAIAAPVVAQRDTSLDLLDLFREFIPAITVNVPAQAAPIIHVAPAEPVVHIAAAEAPDVHVTVEAAPPADVTVHIPPPAEILPPTIVIEPAVVNVAGPATPEINVILEPAPAPDVTVHLPTADQPAPIVNIAPPASPEINVSIEPAPPADVTVNVAPAEMPTPVVNIEPAVVNIAAPDVPEVNVNVEPAPPAEVTVNLPSQTSEAAPEKHRELIRDESGVVVEVEEWTDSETPRRRKVIRDDQGRAIALEEL